MITEKNRLKQLTTTDKTTKSYAPLERQGGKPSDIRISAIKPEHWEEWKHSGIDPELIQFNLISLDGEESWEHLHYGNEERDFRTAKTGEITSWTRRRWGHLEQGGWWVFGNATPDSQWGCFKPDAPYRDSKGKIIKYEHPCKIDKKDGTIPTEIFLLRVSYKIGLKIAIKNKLKQEYLARFNGKIPHNLRLEDTGFWDWVKEQDIPIILTEGVKKAGALLSCGYLTIAIPGIYNGLRNKDGNRQLIPQLLPFANNKRECIFCFDQDEKTKTRHNVESAIFWTSLLFKQQGCLTSKCSWNPSLGKGIDDVLVTTSLRKINHIIKNRNPLTEIPFQLSVIHESINEKYISNKIDLKDYPDKNFVAVNSRQGTGKTLLFSEYCHHLIRQGIPCLFLSIRENLCQQFSEKSGLPYRKEYLQEKLLIGYSSCLDSLIKKHNGFDLEQWSEDNFPYIFIDEIEQLISHLLWGTTDIQQYRQTIYKNLSTLIAKALKHSKLIIGDANLSDYTISFIKEIAQRNDIEFKPHSIFNSYQEGSLKVLTHDSDNELGAKLKQDLKENKTLLICSASQGSGSKWSTKNLEKLALKHYKREEVVRIDRQTIGEKEHLAIAILLNIMSKKQGDISLIEMMGIKVIILSPVGLTGFSIDIFNYFEKNYVFGGNGHLSPNDLVQFLWRLRDFNVPRYVYYPVYSTIKQGSGSGSQKQLGIDDRTKQHSNYKLMSLAIVVDNDGNIQTDDSLYNTWCKWGARYNRYQHNYGGIVRFLLQQQNTIFLNEHNLDNQAILDAKQEIKEIKEDNIKIDATELEEARQIDKDEYELIKAKKVKTREEQLAEQRYQLERMFLHLTNKKIEAMIRNKGTYRQLRNAYLATVGKQFSQRKQLEKLELNIVDNNGEIPAVMDSNKLCQETKYELLARVLRALGSEVSNFKLAKIAEDLRKVEDQIRLFLGINIKGLKEQALFNHILKLCGLRLKIKEKKMIEGEVIKIYALESAIKPLSLADINEQMNQWYNQDISLYGEDIERLIC